MATLRTEPTGWASWNVKVISGGEDLTELRISLFRSRGTFELDGDSFTIEPQGFFRHDAELRRGASVLARSEKDSFTRRRFTITSAGHRLTLESRSFTGREYALLLGRQEVGSLKRRGFLGRKCELELPEEVPFFLQVFLIYLVLSQARREAAAASG